LSCSCIPLVIASCSSSAAFCAAAAAFCSSFRWHITLLKAYDHRGLLFHYLLLLRILQRHLLRVELGKPTVGHSLVADNRLVVIFCL
jgi:hypothetical protein